MTTLKFVDTHNMVVFLSKPTKSDGFEQIVDFLNAHPIRYALTVNPTIYTSCIKQFWSTVKAKTINGEAQLHALVDGKKIIITEASVRRDLQLADEEGVECLPNSTIFEQLALMGYEKVPQPSDPSENVTDEVVYKELGDSLVRDATTASSLEAEQDSGNIIKTRSKAIPNESSSLRTTSGGGPRCQETKGDTIAQTRLKLDELMALYTTLQTRVLDLEKTNTSQHNEIARLKRRVKKLEKKDRSRTHKVKRLYKVGLTDRVESFDNEESLGEDASKHGRINAIDADGEITLVSVQNVDEEMFDVNVLDGEEVFIAEQEVVANEKDDDGEITLAQALIEMKSTKPKVKRAVIQEPGESTTTISSQLSSQQSQNKDEFDEEERLAREKAEKEKEANIALIETWDDIHAKIDVDYQLAERLQAQEQEELSVEEKATLFQQLLEKK
ncbi:hypothetical protein Tco_1068314 [Tanacetum coccineum]|uniref:Xylulose kinase-1 n=1 Tax=Tanacetum coccineum TaxID=301880 RepID=A0ABQ5HFC3_9ASTR